MENKDTIVNEINELRDTVNNVNNFFKAKSIIDEKKIRNQRLIIICTTIILIMSFVVNAFFVYQLSQYEKVVETTTETTEQYVDGNSNINNIEGNQYNDNATHNESSEGE